MSDSRRPWDNQNPWSPYASAKGDHETNYRQPTDNNSHWKIHSYDLPYEAHRSGGGETAAASTGIAQKSFSFDFKRFLVPAHAVPELEREPEFRRGSTDELDRVVSTVVSELRSGKSLKACRNIANRLSVFGREYASHVVYLTGDLAKLTKDKGLILKDILELFNLLSEYFGFEWRFGGFINPIDDRIVSKDRTQIYGLQIYADREDKKENAPAFLKRIYAEELAAGTLTLSDLGKIDKSLWAGLRNWASAGKHDLDGVIPRGRTMPGRPREELGFDPSTLDAENPIHALALQAVEVRARGRERASRSYSAKRLAR